jgi:4-amino-4-deoxy-L-arabinose transferase-like glycosyltransferase
MHLPRLALAPHPGALAVIVLAFLLPGLASHDPWKTHDVIGLAIVHGMAGAQDGLVPRVAGMLWLYDGPLYHWVALAFGRLLGGLLEFHAAARLASGAFMLAAFWLLYLTARDWSADADRRTTAAAAVLLMLGSVGLMVHAHEALPEIAALAGVCGALAALPHVKKRPLVSGAAFGAGLGVAALAATWMAPSALGLAGATAVLACAEWRNRSGLAFLIAAALVGFAVAASWPLALALRSPDLLATWATSALRPEGTLSGNLRYFLATGSWFAWPAWPLAFWAAWSSRRRWREARVFVPGVAALFMLVAVIYKGPPHDVNLIALLAPLALLGAQGLWTLRRGAAGALDWFGVLCFAFFAALVWLGYVAMMTGVPPKIANNFLKTAPGFQASFDAASLLLALALTAGWLYVVLYPPAGPLRTALRWAAGVVLLWGLFAALWMPWADYQKSYRTVALQLRSKIPVGAPCVAQRSLGVSQAAALQYHADLQTRPFDVLAPSACPLLLVQGTPKHEYDAPGPGWIKLADVGRPGDKAERYRLYQLRR